MPVIISQAPYFAFLFSPPFSFSLTFLFLVIADLFKLCQKCSKQSFRNLFLELVFDVRARLVNEVNCQNGQFFYCPWVQIGTQFVFLKGNNVYQVSQSSSETKTLIFQDFDIRKLLIKLTTQGFYKIFNYLMGQKFLRAAMLNIAFNSVFLSVVGTVLDIQQMP